MALLEIKDLHASVADNEILKGINLTIKPGEVHAIMGPNGSGKSTLSNVLAGNEAYTKTSGQVLFDGIDIDELAAHERACAGMFLAFQYPVEIAGISNMYFLKAAVNAVREYQGKDQLDAMDFLDLIEDKKKVVQIRDDLLERAVNSGFSGGEKKRNEIFQMAMLEPKLGILDETDSGLDIDALRIVSDGVNALRSPDRGFLVITHYQRLLDYIVPDYVHVLVDGKIVKSGGKELALELESEGYASWVDKKGRIIMDLKELREKAAVDFKANGFPTTKEELWRFTDVSRVAGAEFSNDWKPSELEFQPLDKITVVFENGKLSREKSNLEDLPTGVCIGSIMDLVDPRIGTLADAQSAFVSSNTAYFGDGAFIEVTEGVKMDTPIHLVYLADIDGAAFHMRNFISAGKDAAVTVVEEYIGLAGATYWTNVVTEAFVADGGLIDHYKVQRESDSSYHFQTLEAHLGKESVFSNHAVTLGAALGRNDIRGKLTGEEGEAICNGLYLLKDNQLFDTHIFMDHAVPKCNSHELYKGILDDKARAVFCGRILVQKDAQQTDAIQSNGNLLLSRGAKVNTLPQLEIYADDVKCTHGATIGQLDEVGLYYLQTRGIDPVKGHAMLTFAFANEVLDEVKCKPAKVYIEGLVHDWLDKVAR